MVVPRMTPLPWELARQLWDLLESGASDDIIVNWADQARCRLRSSSSELDKQLDAISAMTMAPEMGVSRRELENIAQRMQDIHLARDYLADVLKETPEGYVPLKWTQRALPSIPGLRLLCMKCMCAIDPRNRDRCDCEAVTVEPDTNLVSSDETEVVRFLVPLNAC